MQAPNDHQDPVKDENAAHPIATAWRPVIKEIVRAFAQSDYALTRGAPLVDPVPPQTVARIRAYLADYGETLEDLPEASWKTSVAQWMGTHWDIIVDLWTAESGQSDLALCVRVFEEDGRFRFQVQSVHVP